jgi:hypothetical protein
MTAIEQALRQGFQALQIVAGVRMTADTGESCVGTIEDIQPLQDPEEAARSKLPIYAHIETDSDAVEHPQNIKTFTEDANGRTHRVLRYLPQAADRFTFKWLVETQRT